MSKCPYFGTNEEEHRINCPHCVRWEDATSSTSKCSIHEQLKNVRGVWPLMEMYLGAKIVKARPMLAGQAVVLLNREISVANADAEGNGYLVEYEDGYQSWSPKEQFEKAYRRTSGMTFGLATEAMLKGMLCELPGWEDKSIGIQLPGDNSVSTLPYYYQTSQGLTLPWIPSHIELLSTAWRLTETK